MALCANNHAMPMFVQSSSSLASTPQPSSTVKMLGVLRRGPVLLASGTCTTAAGCAWLYSQHLEAQPPPLHSALQPNKSLKCPLLEVEQLTHDTARFRFGLPTPEHRLGLPCCSHVLAHDAMNVERAYTPVTVDGLDPPGSFDLVVKRYEGGLFSEAFHKLKPCPEGTEGSMHFRGPVVTLAYEPNTVRCLGLVCGGTGITPMYQLIRTVLANPNDHTMLRLVYANRSSRDVILEPELRALAVKHPQRLKVRFLLSGDEKEEGGGGETGIGGVGGESGPPVARWWRWRGWVPSAGEGSQQSRRVREDDQNQESEVDERNKIIESGEATKKEKVVKSRHTSSLGDNGDDAGNRGGPAVAASQLVSPSVEVVKGRVGAATLRRLGPFLPPPSDPSVAVLVCGPPGMMRSLCGGGDGGGRGAEQGRKEGEGARQQRDGGVLFELGYSPRQVVKFADGNGVQY